MTSHAVAGLGSEGNVLMQDLTLRRFSANCKNQLSLTLRSP